jgi:hypothetical protein
MLGATADTVSSISFWVKAGERSRLGLRAYTKVPGSAFSYIDGSDGTIVSADASHTVTLLETSGSWYRFSISWDIGSGASNPAIEMYLVSSGTTTSYSGDGSSGLYIWGVQYEVDQPFASSYISTDSYNLNGGGYLDLPGASGDYASAPDSAPLSVTGDIDIRSHVLMDDYTPASQVAVISKWGGGTNSYLLLMLSDSSMRLVWNDGSTRIASSTAGMSLTDGQEIQVRVTLDVDDGSGGHDVTFYSRAAGTALSDSTGWTQLGTVVSAGSFTTSIVDGTATVTIGSQGGGTADLWSGRTYRAQIYDGIAGTLVFDADFTDISTHAATRLSVTENANSAVVTVHSNSAATTRSADVLYFDWPFAPQEMTVYYSANMYCVANVGAINFRPWMVGNATDGVYSFLWAGGDSLITYLLVGGAIKATATKSSLGVTIGALLEIRIAIAANGDLAVGVSVDGGTEAVNTGTSTAALPSAWGVESLALTASGSEAYHGVRSVKAARGTKTMAEMRLL